VGAGPGRSMPNRTGTLSSCGRSCATWWSREAVFQENGPLDVTAGDVEALGIPGEAWREVIGRRLSRLSEPSAHLLTLGARDRAELRPGGPQRARGDARRPAVIEGIEEAAGGRPGCVRSPGSPGRYTLRSRPSCATTLYEELSAPPGRMEFHRAVGAALESARRPAGPRGVLRGARPPTGLAATPGPRRDGVGRPPKATEYAEAGGPAGHGPLSAYEGGRRPLAGGVTGRRPSAATPAGGPSCSPISARLSAAPGDPVPPGNTASRRGRLGPSKGADAELASRARAGQPARPVSVGWGSVDPERGGRPWTRTLGAPRAPTRRPAPGPAPWPHWRASSVSPQTPAAHALAHRIAVHGPSPRRPPPTLGRTSLAIGWFAPPGTQPTSTNVPRSPTKLARPSAAPTG